MENSKFSFTNFTSTGSAKYNSDSSTRKPTERQIQYYMDLCVQRKVAPQNYTAMTYDEVGALIEELRKFYPASENQIKMIKDKLELLSTMGVAINAPDYSKLTGGREGTASALIEGLISMERQYTDKMPATDSQLQFMVSMYLCPDVPFESFEIARKVDLGDGMWRKFTPEEFAEEIKSKMNKRDASAFIDANRGAFHTWKQTRVRPEQVKYIRQLEDRMANLTPTSVIEWAVDEEGNLVQIQKQVADKSKAYAPTGYTPLDEMELMMFSVEEASKYIDILKSEYERKDLYKYGEVADESLTFESLRKANSVEQQKENELKELNDLMFKLEAVAGYADEELHNAVTSLLLEKEVVSEKVQEQRNKIHDFMMELIEDDSATFEGMVELCKNSPIAQEILMKS